MFGCQHQSLDAIITWQVNGSSVNQFPDAEEGGSGNMGSLTIPSVQAEYNGTEVVCLAIFLDINTPRELTPPVTLTVIQGWSYKLVLKQGEIENIMFLIKPRTYQVHQQPLMAQHYQQQ